MSRQISPIVSNASSRPDFFDSCGFFFSSFGLRGGASLAVAAFDAADSFVTFARRDLRFGAIICSSLVTDLQAQPCRRLAKLKGLAALATTFVLSMTTLPGCADAEQREASKISNLGQYELRAHHRHHYRYGHYYQGYRYPPYYGFGGYFRPFGGYYGGYYGGYFGSDDGYDPCGLGRTVLEGCGPY